MNPKYFKDQICEELEGACDYLKKAMDTSTAHPEWSEHFKNMAEMEQQHATTLYKMFMEMYTETQGKDAYMSAIRDSIMDCFSLRMRKIEDLKSAYDILEEEYSHAPSYIPKTIR